MGHTKRSPEFRSKVDSLIHRVNLALGFGGDSGELAREVTEVLLNNTTDSGCMVKAAEDEPVFVLRAQDIDADKCVDHWSELQIDRALYSKNKDEPLTKISDARDCAREMRAFHHRREAD